MTDTITSIETVARPSIDLHGEATAPVRLAKEVWRARELLVILARKEFHVKYRRASFGVLWAIGLPLLQSAVMADVFLQGGEVRTCPALRHLHPLRNDCVGLLHDRADGRVDRGGRQRGHVKSRLFPADSATTRPSGYRPLRLRDHSRHHSGPLPFAGSWARRVPDFPPAGDAPAHRPHGGLLPGGLRAGRRLPRHALPGRSRRHRLALPDAGHLSPDRRATRPPNHHRPQPNDRRHRPLPCWTARHVWEPRDPDLGVVPVDSWPARCRHRPPLPIQPGLRGPAQTMDADRSTTT